MTQTKYASQMAWLLTFGHTPAQVAERLALEQRNFEDAAVRAQPHWHAPLPQRTWTPAQEAEHVILVAESSAKIAALLLSDKPLRNMPQTPIVTDAQGRRQAPAGTVPGQGQPWEALSKRATAVGETLQAAALNAPDDAATGAADRKFWHQAMGELTALDWLRMTAFHTRHHRKKLEAGLKQLEASALEISQ